MPRSVRDAASSCERTPPHGFGIAAATVTRSGPAEVFAIRQRRSATGMPLASASPFTSGFIASSVAETGIDGSSSATCASG